MKNKWRRMLCALLCFALCLPVLQIRADVGLEGEEDGIFYINENTEGKSSRSFDNGSRHAVSNVRYDKFRCSDDTPSTPQCPNLGIGIKYIVGDDKNPDGKGKWRYVYCLDFEKDSPENGLEMNYSGWANKKVAYALYYGAMYYYDCCRYEPYSTGDWQMDYFVTQMAIHVLNGEFTLAALRKGMDKSTATLEEKNRAYDKIDKLVKGANNEANYEGFTSDGWLDMNTGSFTMGEYKDSWYYDSGTYISDSVFHTEFKSYYQYDFCEQLTAYEISVPEGVSVRRKGKELYADFDLTVSEDVYRQWQLTGKTIPVKVTAEIPRYWGGGIYKSPTASNYQSVCLLTWKSAGDKSSFVQSAQLNIPKVTRDLTIYKRDAETGEELSGASFSLWAYDGENYSSQVGTFVDQNDGSYVCTGIDYTSTTDGWFLIKEDEAPEPYDKNYQKENSSDEEDFHIYGGREIRMNADGFWSDKVSEPFVFRDKKLIPKAELSVMKYNIDNGENVEGAEFSVYEWDNTKGGYEEEAVCVLSYDQTKQRYKTEQPLVKSQENEGKFLVKETNVPQGYHCPWSQEIVLTEYGTVTMELQAPNYPGRKFTVYKKILKEEVTWEHGNPTFFFEITGTDLEGKHHTYHCFVEFTPDRIKGQEGVYAVGETTVSDIPAGIYRVEEKEDVMRYILTDAVSDQEHVQVEKKSAGPVNGVEKIQAEVTADLRLKDGSITFENRKVLYDEYSDNAVTVNHFVNTKEE